MGLTVYLIKKNKDEELTRTVLERSANELSTLTIAKKTILLLFQLVLLR